MTPDDVFAAAELFQSDDRVWGLRCPQRHGPLKPVRVGHGTVLVCPTCHHKQDRIPGIVLDWYYAQKEQEGKGETQDLVHAPSPAPETTEVPYQGQNNALDRE